MPGWGVGQVACARHTHWLDRPGIRLVEDTVAVAVAIAHEDFGTRLRRTVRTRLDRVEDDEAPVGRKSTMGEVLEIRVTGDARISLAAPSPLRPAKEHTRAGHEDAAVIDLRIRVDGKGVRRGDFFLAAGV